ncbi:hypothetical protein BJV82DRAFT_507108, partial [Fennellomyces sp. T-0311]
WFRSLHHNLSCRSLLHWTNPCLFESDICILCQEDVDDLEHFLFRCSRKRKFGAKSGMIYSFSNTMTIKFSVPFSNCNFHGLHQSLVATLSSNQQCTVYGAIIRPRFSTTPHLPLGMFSS